MLLFAFFGDVFMLGNIFTRNAFFYLPLAYFSFHVHGFLGKCCRKAINSYKVHLRKRRARALAAWPVKPKKAGRR
ncbi:MAG: hypothetical protein ACK5LX_08380 [Oscillospiraceae bacterium]